MERVLEQLARRRLLNDPPEIHDGHAIGHLANDAEVVGDQEVRQLLLPWDVSQQVQDLRLDRDIQGARRFIEQEKFRFGCEGSSNRDPLSLASGELMRKSIEVVGPQSDVFKKLRGSFERLGPRHQVDEQDRLGGDVLHEHPGIEGGERVLEYGLHVPPVWLQRSRAEPRDRELVQRTRERAGPSLRRFAVVLLSMPEVPDLRVRLRGHVEENLTRRRGDQTKEQTTQRRLAATAFSDQGERLTSPNVHVDAVYGADSGDRPAEDSSFDGEVFLDTDRRDNDVMPWSIRLRHGPLRRRTRSRRPYGSGPVGSTWVPRSCIGQTRTCTADGTGIPTAGS